MSCELKVHSFRYAIGYRETCSSVFRKPGIGFHALDVADPSGLNAPSLWVKLLVSEISIYLMPSGGGGRIVMVSLVLALLRLINCCICTFSCSIHLCVY